MKLLASLICLTALGQDADVVCRKAVELHQSGDVRSALGQYEACLALRPDAGPLRSNYGAALAGVGRYQDAIAQYEQSLRLSGDDPRLRFNLALAYYKSGAIPKAASELTRLHSEQPQAAQITLLLADCNLQLGELQKVIDLLSPIEAEQKDNLAFSYMLGMALIRMGHVDRGQTVVDRILKDGKSPEAHLLIAHAAFTRHDYPQAVQEFAKALELNPGLTGAQSFYGQSLLYTGDADGAVVAFRKTLDSNPIDYEANVKLGSILAVRKQFKEALPLLEQARQVHQDAIEAHMELAGVYKQLGRSAEAAKEEAAVKALGGETSAVEDTGLLAAGTAAPDFLLGTPERDKKIALRELVKKMPVALVFGSYTCPKFRGDADALNKLAEMYRGKIQFVLVYVHEAHSNADWQSSVNQREQVALAPARTLAEKQTYAQSCARKLKIPYSVVVDDMDRKVEKAYAAWPSAVYVIGNDGRIQWSSRLGEQAFRAENMRRIIANLTVTGQGNLK